MARTIWTPTYVLPVPGGPCTSASSRCIESSTAFTWGRSMVVQSSSCGSQRTGGSTLSVLAKENEHTLHTHSTVPAAQSARCC